MRRNRDLPERTNGGHAAVSRREFLAAAGVALGAGALPGVQASVAAGRPSPGAAGSSIPSGGALLSPVGVQLYTVRRAMQASVERTLEEVAGIGYREVEFAGYFGRTPRQVRAILDANGLSAPSSHGGGLDVIRSDWARALDDAAVVGHKYLVCASLPGSERTADGYKRVAALFNDAGAAAERAGIRLAYHNHDFEFEALGDTIGYDILLAETDRRLVDFQMDLFWIVRGGRDPLDYFARNAARFPSVHVKDMDQSGAMVDVGAGRLPFARYFAQASQAGIRHYFVEHDNPADPMASIRASFQHMRQL